MEEKKLERLITEMENNLPQMEQMAQMFGGGVFGKMVAGNALQNTKDVIEALKELRDLQKTKKLIDGA